MTYPICLHLQTTRHRSETHHPVRIVLSCGPSGGLLGRVPGGRASNFFYFPASSWLWIGLYSRTLTVPLNIMICFFFLQNRSNVLLNHATAQPRSFSGRTELGGVLGYIQTWGNVSVGRQMVRSALSLTKLLAPRLKHLLGTVLPAQFESVALCSAGSSLENV